MKTWPHCSLSPFSKFLTGIAAVVTLTAATSSFSQTAPLEAPTSLRYPGVYESFEKMIQFDETRFETKSAELAAANKTLGEIKDINAIDVDPDFMNSLILNSPAGYLRLAGRDRCAFYDTLITDLLKTKDGKVSRVFIQYQDQDGQNISAIVSKKDFLEKVVYQSCPKTKEIIAKFQIKVIDQTIKATNFDVPNNREQCEFVFNTWSDDPHTPYWCQIHELIAETDRWAKTPSLRDPAQKKEQDTRVAIARILKTKLSDNQRDFVQNFCSHANNSKLFCDEFFSTNFFSKVLDGTKPDIYVKDICQTSLGKTAWSPAVLKECVRKLKDEQDACFYGAFETTGLSPRPRCDHLSLALNYSALEATYDDCPRYSDQQAVTNVSRIIRHLDRPPVLPTQGFCSAVSAGTVFEFNRRFGNEDQWQAAVCYFDRVDEKERCLPVFYGDYGASAASLTSVVAEVLYRTKGAGKDTKCKIIRQSEWNPALLEYRYGCQILVDENNCGMGQCAHKVMLNEKEIKGLKVREGLALDYFPTNLTNEKYSQTYVLQKDAQKKMLAVTTLTGLQSFFKQHTTGILHGVGCAEDLLPSFFRKHSLNQCSPLPFIVDGMIADGDRIVLVTRSAADSLHAPRLISWSLVFSAVKTYQFHNPIRQWTLHGIY